MLHSGLGVEGGGLAGGGGGGGWVGEVVIGVVERLSLEPLERL